MTANGPQDSRKRVSDALARAAYLDDRVRITGTSLAGADCLVASRQGLYAVSRGGAAELLVWGRFFGVRLHDGHIYAFETCGMPSATGSMGRIVRFDLAGDQLANPRVLAKDLDNNCHQIAVIDGLIWVVDTANQQVLRFTLKGEPLDSRTVIGPVTRGQKSAAYRHVNSIARVADGLALLLHNGGKEHDPPSELLILDPDWNERRRIVLAGHGCHDIAEDGQGRLWHCGSMAGEVIDGGGRRWKVSDMMTRGLAIAPHGLLVGYSHFGARKGRETLPGGVLFLDHAMTALADVPMAAAPTDLVVLQP